MNKIPDSAELVFKGFLFDVYQWQQEMYDGTFATFERLRRADTVSILAITADKKIIITHEEQPGLNKFQGSPGGVVDANEVPLDAAKRELAEETGYVSNHWHQWSIHEPMGKIDWKMYLYIARNCELKLQQHLDSGEKIEIQLMDVDEFIDAIQQDTFRDKVMSWKIMKLLLSSGKKTLTQFLFQS